jgi:hypothetical protein
LTAIDRCGNASAPMILMLPKPAVKRVTSNP